MEMQSDSRAFHWHKLNQLVIGLSCIFKSEFQMRFQFQFELPLVELTVSKGGIFKLEHPVLRTVQYYYGLVAGKGLEKEELVQKLLAYI